jgi:hypothetical protein
MGSWSVSCGLSNIAITAGQECYILPLIQVLWHFKKKIKYNDNNSKKK